MQCKQLSKDSKLCFSIIYIYIIVPAFVPLTKQEQRYRAYPFTLLKACSVDKKSKKKNEKKKNLLVDNSIPFFYVLIYKAIKVYLYIKKQIIDYVKETEENNLYTI